MTIKIAARDEFSTVVAKYNTAMGQAERATREMGTASRQTGFDLGDLGAIIGGLGFVIGAREVLNFSLEMADLGSKVKATSAIFRELADDMGDPADAMRLMREATLGVVDDMTLMGGANQLLKMHLATTNEELAKMTEIAVKLKRPTVDATTAIQDFSALLAQQSILRLDNFGFSSGRVRDRINELLESGEALNRSDAFRLAVMEQGQEALDRLGGAADVARTNVGLLTNELENMKQRASVVFADVAEDAAGFALNFLGQKTPEQLAADALALEDLGAVLGFAFNDPAMMATLPHDFVIDYVKMALQTAEESPELLANMTGFTHTVLNRLGKGMTTGSEGLPEFQFSRTLAEATVQIQAGNQAQRESVRLAQEAAAAEAERLIILEEQANLARVEGERAQLRGQFGSDFFGLEASLAGMGVPRGFTDLLSGDFELPEFMTEQQSDAWKVAADEAQRMYDFAKEMDELDSDLFDDAQLDQMKEIADATGKFASEAEKAEAALNNISLSDVFGLGSRSEVDSLTGQIGDLVAGNIEDPAARAAFEQEYQLASNQTSLGNIALEQEIAPLIASIEDSGLATQATQIVATLLSQAILRGVDPNSPEFISMVKDAIGVQPGMAGASFSVAPGDTIGGLAGQYGLSPDAMMAAAGITDPRMLQPGSYNLPGSEVDASAIENFDSEAFFADFETMSGHADTLSTNINTFWTDISAAQEPVGAVETSMGQISTFADNFAAKIKDLTSKVQTVKIKIETDISGAGSDWLAQQVRNNGGSVPGAVGPQ